jgi:ABC-type glycerol-3-phosphate transport system permease component
VTALSAPFTLLTNPSVPPAEAAAAVQGMNSPPLMYSAIQHNNYRYRDDAKPVREAMNSRFQSCSTMPFGLLVIKNYMDDIPNDIVEASIIDGCSHFMTYWKIVLPLSLPALSAVTIFTFLNAWNEYLLPLVALRKTDLLPVTRLTSFFINQFTRNYHMFFASSVIIILPVVVVYVLLQRYFIKGLTAGALKS